MSTPKIIFGAAVFTDDFGLDPKKTKSFLDAIAALGIDTLDTATIYGTSEEQLGSAHATDRFTIDTKFPGGWIPGVTATKDDVVKYGKASLEKLQTKQVDVYYLHSPNQLTPIEETLAGVDALYKAGAFKRFGVSNFAPEDVEEIVRICKAKGYVLPTVYQGNYNAFSRTIEKTLFPVLRRHGFVFNAYSPSAGGFLAKSSDVLRAGAGAGRWDTKSMLGQLYSALYSKPTLLDGLDTWNAIAKEEGITGIELAYRWTAHNSALDGSRGDGIIVGARTAEQLQENVGWIRKGPLSAGAVKKIDQLWETIAADAPVDNFQGMQQGK